MNTNETQTEQPGVDLGEVVMVPVVGIGGDEQGPELKTDTPAPVKRRGRPSNAEKAAAQAAAAPVAETPKPDTTAVYDAYLEGITALRDADPVPGEGQIVNVPNEATVPADAPQDDTIPTLGVFKMNASSKMPTPATSFSAGADVRANFEGVTEVEAFTSANKPMTTGVRENYGVRSIVLQPGARAKIPTGLIFDIPAGWKLAAYPRSGLSLKSGQNLANCVAVIDCDYTEELFILVANTSQLRIEINHDDRVAQLSLEKVHAYNARELSAPPGTKSERVGGMGSTGVK